jgi:hypothetical protein
MRKPLVCTFVFLAVVLVEGTAPAAENLALNPVVTGLTRPVGITTAGDGSGRLFITIQDGQILVIECDFCRRPFSIFLPWCYAAASEGCLA